MTSILISERTMSRISENQRIKNQNSKLYHLIPEAYSPLYSPRRQRTYNVLAAKTKSFANSFFMKCAAQANSSLR